MDDLGAELDARLALFDHVKTDSTVEMREETKQRLEDLGYLQ